MDSINHILKKLKESRLQEAEQITKEFASDEEAFEWAEDNGYQVTKIQNGKFDQACICHMTKLAQANEAIDIAVGNTFSNAGTTWKILDIKGDYVLVHSSDREYTPYVVAWSLDPKDGSWGQGHYFGTEKEATDYMNKLEESLNEDESEEESENKDYKEFISKCMENPTWKKIDAICNKYHYRLAPASYVEVYPSGKKYIRINIYPDRSDRYAPDIYFGYDGFGPNVLPEFKIQTSSFGSMSLGEHDKYLAAVTSANNMIREIQDIDLYTLYTEESDY